MRQEKEYIGENFSLTYRDVEEGLVITGFSGRVLRVEVPEEIDSKPVVKIDKKAFLSKKMLKEISLPASIKAVDEWAFAYCSGLEKIVWPAKDFTVGKALFLNCGKLEMIQSSRWCDEVGRLLAAAVTGLDAGYLLDGQNIGSSWWLEMWDARLLTVMDTDDMEGYQNQVLCGEEDYGSTDVEAFLQKKRMHKVRLAMLRLLNPKEISKETKEMLETYLQEHTKGCVSEETWLTLMREYSRDLQRIQLFLDLGCADEKNMEAILNDLGEDYPEMKAIFLRYQDAHIGYQDFFAGLEL